jgi:uncharacterized protein YbjQ (UPF0145 family)
VETLLIQIVPFVLLLAVGFGIGTWRERAHLRSLELRERALADITVTTLRVVAEPESVRQAVLVSGGVVIASDYFKSTLGHLFNIIGGEIRAYRTLADRARREATLRMLEEARRLGATEVWNVRYETSNIRGADKFKAAVSVDLFAYGTAVLRK